jgi:hypothetical protein
LLRYQGDGIDRNTSEYENKPNVHSVIHVVKYSSGLR